VSSSYKGILEGGICGVQNVIAALQLAKDSRELLAGVSVLTSKTPLSVQLDVQDFLSERNQLRQREILA